MGKGGLCFMTSGNSKAARQSYSDRRSVHTGLAETGSDLQKTAYKPSTLMTCMIQMIRLFYSTFF